MRESDLIQAAISEMGAHGAVCDKLDGVTRRSVPPGDDMGWIRLHNRDVGVLISVDPVIQGVHYDPATATPEQVAYKAIARNVSDIAAMGARPTGAVVSVVLSRSMIEEDAHRLVVGLVRAGRRLGCPVVGGDTAFSDGPTVITATVMACAGESPPVLRSTARPGEAVCVTGRLGGSLDRTLGEPGHLTFTPRIDAGQELASFVSAMMDLSDGLAMDLPRLCEASGVGAVIPLADLPISPAALAASQTSGRPPWQHAIGDGEDYELLFTCPIDRVPTHAAGIKVTHIGMTTEDAAVSFRDSAGHAIDHTSMGWEHHT